MVDLSAKRFGKLTTIQYIRQKNRDCWECVCDCGNKTIVRWDHLVKKNTKSCGCLHRRTGNKSPFFKGYGDISLDFFNHIKRACQKPQKYRKSRVFEITIEYLWQLFIKQNRKCALTDIEISFTERDGSRGRRCSASLDRIDSSKGYIEGNVQWVHKDVNIMKNDFSVARFQELCRKVTEKIH